MRTAACRWLWFMCRKKVRHRCSNRTTHKQPKYFVPSRHQYSASNTTRCHPSPTPVLGLQHRTKPHEQTHQAADHHCISSFSVVQEHFASQDAVLICTAVYCVRSGYFICPCSPPALLIPSSLHYLGIHTSRCCGVLCTHILL
jgi:hypothetical protein